MDTLLAMKVFVTIHQQGSLTNAAQHLDMSRAMVSRYLEDLENHLKMRLFQRTTRRISLTPAGEAALTQCQHMLALQESLQQISQQQQTELSGLLRLTISPTLMQDVLAEYIVSFAQQHPQVSVEIIASEDTLDLIQQQIDVAIRISNAVSEGLIAKRLGNCHSVLCATPVYLQTAAPIKTPADLLQHDCLGHRHVGRDAWPLKTASGHIEKAPIHVKYCSNEATVLLAMTLQHAGISMLPANLVAPLIAQNRLQVVLNDYPPEPLAIHAIYTSRQHLPKLTRAFLDYIADCFASSSA